MDRDEIVSTVLSHQFAEGQYTDYARSMANEATGYIAAQCDFPQLWQKSTTTLSAGVDTLSLPADFSRLYSLSLQPTDGSAPQQLRQIRPEDYDILNRTDITGAPYLYDLNGLTLDLYPTTDQSYDILLNYWRVPTDMAASSDEPEIPSQYHHLIVTYVLGKCFERENDYDAATYHWGRFENGVLKCRSEVQYSQSDSSGPKTVQGWSGIVADAPLVVWR